jgi:hypothetical protein
MNYSSLEDAFGTPFGQRVPITSSSVEKEDTSKKADNKAKLAEVVKSVEKTLPLDTNPATESFNATPHRSLPTAPLDPSLPSVRDRVREHFAMNGGGGDDSKLDRILNKPKKYVPLMERNFNDLNTLAEQFEWLKRKQRIKDRNAAQ